MEKKLDKLNIILIVLFALNTILFKVKETILDIFLLILPIDATNFLIAYDYILFVFLIINVILIILLQIKNKKLSLTKLNIVVLVIFGISIIFTTPYAHLYEFNDDTEGDGSNIYGQTLYFGKSFIMRKYYEYDEGKKSSTLETQYMYIPLFNKLLIIDNDLSMEKPNITISSIRHEDNYIIIATKNKDGYTNEEYYFKKKTKNDS